LRPFFCTTDYTDFTDTTPGGWPQEAQKAQKIPNAGFVPSVPYVAMSPRFIRMIRGIRGQAGRDVADGACARMTQQPASHSNHGFPTSNRKTTMAIEANKSPVASDQIDAFRKQGYLYYGPLFSPDELIELRQTVQGFIDNEYDRGCHAFTHP
jgi:hypothetical protein